LQRLSLVAQGEETQWAQTWAFPYGNDNESRAAACREHEAELRLEGVAADIILTRTGVRIVLDQKAPLDHARGDFCHDSAALPLAQFHPGVGNALLKQRLPGTVEHAQVQSRNRHQVNHLYMRPGNQVSGCVSPFGCGDG
jgi:hypothetical protein